MKLSLSEKELKKFLERQLEHHFPDGQTRKYFRGRDVDRALETALYRLENCFQYVIFPAYSDDSGQTFFSHLHSDQYAQFLYFFMNTLWKEAQNRVICDKTMLLLRSLNAVFLSYKCELPDIFLLAHPVGTVIGNIAFSDYLCIFQNVTISTAAVRIGSGVTLCVGAKILEGASVGNRVNVGAAAVVYKTKIESDKTVIRDGGGNIIIKDSRRCLAETVFRDIRL